MPASSGTGSLLQPLVVLLFVVIMFLSQSAKRKKLERREQDHSGHEQTETVPDEPREAKQAGPHREVRSYMAHDSDAANTAVTVSKEILGDGTISIQSKAEENVYAAVKPLSETQAYDTDPGKKTGHQALLGEYDASELKRLIVWAEVLGKPRAFSEFDGDGARM